MNQLASWADALTEDADLLFYGCDLAGNAEGEQFIESISAITGADVAASDDVTGHESQAGDWELEVSTGTIEVRTLEAHNWVGALQTVILASDQADSLVAADATDTNPATNEEIIGPFVNALNVEAIARDPFTGELYGANGNNLGLINQDTGEYTTIGTTFGTASSASAGFSQTLGPVVALGFDPTNGDFLGVGQRAGADVLFKIDTATGTFVADAFGAGEDFVLIDTSGAGAGAATDDIAVDDTGRIFITTGAELAEVIVTGNTSTVNLIGSFGPGIIDVEGLSADANGNLVGSTGGAGGATANSIWQIDKTTGAATNQIQLDDAGDYEGLEAFINTVDLELEKTTTNSFVNVGDTVTFTVTVTNTDPDILAPGVEVTDPVPPGLTFVSANASKGSYDSTTNVWDIGVIAGGSSETIQLTYEVTSLPSSGLITNSAEISDAYVNDPDSTPDNLVVSEDDQDLATITTVSFDKDGDGVADVDDLDDDNDGILDIDEGYQSFTLESDDFPSAPIAINVDPMATSLVTGDVFVVENVGDFDVRIEFTEVNLETAGATATINNAGRITIRNAGDNEINYVAYELSIVESGSVTAGNLAGTIVPVVNAQVFISDIDARNNSQFSDVGGIDTATGSTPDAVVVLSLIHI